MGESRLFIGYPWRAKAECFWDEEERRLLPNELGSTNAATTIKGRRRRSDEVRLRPEIELLRWQNGLAGLFNHVLRFGMPMEQLQLPSFRDAYFHSRNAEEALLVGLNACARVTGQVSTISSDLPTAFGAWFRRIQGQRSGPESALAASCLSYLDISDATLDIADFYGADFSHSILRGVSAAYSCFCRAQFFETNLSGAVFWQSNFEDAWLDRPVVTGAHFQHIRFWRTRINGVDFAGTLLTGSDFTEAMVKDSSFENANLEEVRIPAALRPKKLPIAARRPKAKRAQGQLDG